MNCGKEQWQAFVLSCGVLLIALFAIMVDSGYSVPIYSPLLALVSLVCLVCMGCAISGVAVYSASEIFGERKWVFLIPLVASLVAFFRFISLFT